MCDPLWRLLVHCGSLRLLLKTVPNQCQVIIRLMMLIYELNSQFFKCTIWCWMLLAHGCKRTCRLHALWLHQQVTLWRGPQNWLRKSMVFAMMKEENVGVARCFCALCSPLCMNILQCTQEWIEIGIVVNVVHLHRSSCRRSLIKNNGTPFYPTRPNCEQLQELRQPQRCRATWAMTPFDITDCHIQLLVVCFGLNHGIAIGLLQSVAFFFFLSTCRELGPLHCFKIQIGKC